METYQTIALTTAHLTSEDCQILDDNPHSMVAPRESGFFFKLYEEGQRNHWPELSDSTNRLIQDCWAKGFRLIEFDRDADELEGYPVFEA